MPKKVLLIEYEPRYIERIRTLLTPLGHTISEAHDGEAGIQAFGGSRFDLILLSGMLPRLPSAEVIREIRKKGGATAPPIILMMSGYRGSNRKADAQKVGAFDILQRPFTDEDFVAAVRDAVDSSDLGAKTMRVDTTQLPGSPLTSSDIFSDVLSDLTGEASRPAPRAAAPASDKTLPPPVKAASSESDIEKRLRDTLSGLNLGGPKPTRAADAAPAPPKPKLSSDTDVDKMISDTLSGISLPKPKGAPSAGAIPTPPPMPPPPAAAAFQPRRREEPAAAVPSTGPDHFGQY